MKTFVVLVALSATVLAAGSAAAHPRKARVPPTPAPYAGVHPEVRAMIESNKRSPYIPNAGLYEWRQSMDTHTGVPPGVSGATQANPWVNRMQHRAASGMRW